MTISKKATYKILITKFLHIQVFFDSFIVIACPAHNFPDRNPFTFVEAFDILDIIH